MATPTIIAGYLALFFLIAVVFVFVNLLVGRFLRPAAPNEEKLEIYECGEPTIGSSFVQFDLRFYVVALLFIIFDVEVAFFFPWATVFGKSTQLMNENIELAVAADLDPTVETAGGGAAVALTPVASARLRELGIAAPEAGVLAADVARREGLTGDAVGQANLALRQTATRIAWTSFTDIVVFFGVLMVGFAYVWKRGDLNWVRAAPESHQELPRHSPSSPGHLSPGQLQPGASEQEIVLSI